MNKEIVKAMNRKEKKHTIHKWWNKNGYKVNRIIFFPVWIGLKTYHEIQERLNQRVYWDEEKAQEILNYYIPRRSEWDEENKEFYFFDNGYGWGMAKKYLKRRDRRFWKLHKGFCGGMIRDYLINEFELEGFTKEVGDCSNSWTEIIFKLGVDK